MLGILGRRRQLRRSVTERRLDEGPLYDLSAKQEGYDSMTALAQRSRRALRPPVELLSGARPLGEVLERERERTQRLACGRTVRRARQPASGVGSDGQLADLAHDATLDECDDFLFGQDARNPADEVANRLAEPRDVARIAQKLDDP